MCMYAYIYIYVYGMGIIYNCGIVTVYDFV